MAETKRRNGWATGVRDRIRPLAAGVAVVVAAIAVAIDFATWIQLNVSILYGLPLVLGAPARSRRLLWGLALALLSTTFIVYSLQIPRGAFALHEPFFVNRVLTSAAMLLTAGLLHVWIDAVDVLDAQGRFLLRQNDALEAANRELTRHGAVIARQNEELDRRRRDAEAASQRKTQVLTSVSHDLRSPLHAINVMADVIRRTAGDPALAADVPALARRLQANAVSLSDLVTNVLDISTLDSGRVTLHESEFPLHELVSEQCSHLRPLAQAKGLTLTAPPPTPSPRVKTDRSKLMRVVQNLIGNAIKFTDDGGVSVTTGVTPQGVVEIAVRDTGIGIAAGDVKRVFDEFARLDDQQRTGSGWGLGLAISRRLVQVMGGTITVESEPNVGTLFTVRLPASCVVDPGAPVM